MVHCQPVGDGQTAFKCLAPYIFRVAISNKRILKWEDDRVTFAYRRGDSGQHKTATVSVAEFIRRFLQHVLPKGLCKVRYYGLFSPSKRHRLEHVRRLRGSATRGSATESPPAEASDATSSPPTLSCPSCGQPMQWVATVKPTSRAPPQPLSLRTYSPP